MINMIRADFYRLIRSKSIYIAIFILLLMIGADIYTVQPANVGLKVDIKIENDLSDMTNTGLKVDTEIENDLSDMTYEEISALSISEFREIMLRTKGYALDRDILACNMNLYYIFIFVAVIVIAAEFSGSMVKNTLSSAINRRRYFLSKIVFVNLCCVGLFLLNTYVVYFANILFNNKDLASGFDVITKVTLLQLPPILALTSILAGLAFILKKTSVFNTIVIPLIMIFQILLNVASVFFKIKEEWLTYELQQMLIRLTLDPSKNYILRSYLVCAVIIAAFYAVGYLSFKKAEIR